MTADSSQSGTTEWLPAGFSTVDAQTFIDAGVPLAVAQKWTDLGFEPDDAVEYIDKNVPHDEADDLREREIELWQITRTDTGYEVQLEPWPKDPVEQLPKSIEAGSFGLSLWSSVPWNDDHRLKHEVFFTWDGQHTVDWSVLSGAGLSVMSEVSFRGLASWPYGKHGTVAYTGDDGGRGYDELDNAAPTVGDPNGAKDPEQWVQLATSLVSLTEELLESGIEPRNEFAYEYRRCADDQWFEFNDMFHLYLANAGIDGTLPDFGEWLKAALAEGTYEIP
ncbi:hypothetical protein KL864_18260 [Mycolicibacterium goodii]|uniref:hypothetical protein n=1 Tax=Mycolicibacterium goodii TaxID=134601 RepID=UPI001BDC2382|nr:hypothetical protein [Mycolicibacterium goodii]MBU8817845.1 hypothetical protein [Mycolicibacterium goodii]